MTTTSSQGTGIPTTAARSAKPPARMSKGDAQPPRLSGCRLRIIGRTRPNGMTKAGIRTRERRKGGTGAPPARGPRRPAAPAPSRWPSRPAIPAARPPPPPRRGAATGEEHQRRQARRGRRGQEKGASQVVSAHIGWLVAESNTPVYEPRKQAASRPPSARAWPSARDGSRPSTTTHRPASRPRPAPRRTRRRESTEGQEAPRADDIGDHHLNIGRQVSDATACARTLGPAEVDDQQDAADATSGKAR